MKKYIFTFGLGQPHRKRYQVIYAKSYDEARELMFEAYGNQWSWQYNEDQWKVTLENIPSMREYTPLDDVIYQQE